jgi:hypothetical protein
MTGRAEGELEVRALLGASARAGRLALLLGAVVAVIAALVFAVLPSKYEGTLVVVPVHSARTGGLNDAASLLGSTLELGASGFDATREVVAYLLRSRTVLLAAAAKPYQGRPLAIPIARREPKPGDEEHLLSALRRALRVTSSKETGFVTLALRARDSGAVRAFLAEVVGQTQRLFSEVAQSQAHQLLQAQERRLDSAEAELRQREDRLLRFDEGNRILAPRSRLSLERARLERATTSAAQVHEQVTADRQSAIARELEEAPAIAIVEQLPQELFPKPRRVLFRSLLLGVAIAGAGVLLGVTRELARGSRALQN